MRYKEGKEQSAEFLRLALPLMARQTAAYHPVSYSLWYEYVAGLNPALSQVLAERLAANTPLSEDDAYRLHARYISARDVKLLEGLHQQLCHMLEGTVRDASLAGEETGRFGQILEERRTQLAGTLSLEGLQYVVSELVRDTRHIETTTLALAQKLEARTEEVRILTEQLQRAQTEATLDPLSGLHNRRGFELAVTETSGLTQELAGVALLLADIDHFKQLNDTHGHLLGDKALRSIAQTMRASIKGRDIAARIGGDEFAILLPQTPIQGAATLAEQLRIAVANGRIRRTNGAEVVGAITVSIGLAVANPGECLDVLMERADAALYRAKRDGRNRVCIADA